MGNVVRSGFVSMLLTLILPAIARGEDSQLIYKTTLQSSLKAMERKDGKDSIVKDMSTLVQHSKILLKGFAKAVPECREYLDKALAVADQMPSMALDKLEKDYHADAALPKAPGLCHHAKDLLVHPATVLVMLKSEKLDYGRMQAELVELSSHLTVVTQKMQGK